jgi:hypothetical protein
MLTTANEMTDITDYKVVPFKKEPPFQSYYPTRSFDNMSHVVRNNLVKTKNQTLIFCLKNEVLSPVVTLTVLPNKTYLSHSDVDSQKKLMPEWVSQHQEDLKSLEFRGTLVGKFLPRDTKNTSQQLVFFVQYSIVDSEILPVKTVCLDEHTLGEQLKIEEQCFGSGLKISSTAIITSVHLNKDSDTLHCEEFPKWAGYNVVGFPLSEISTHASLDGVTAAAKLRSTPTHMSYMGFQRMGDQPVTQQLSKLKK